MTTIYGHTWTAGTFNMIEFVYKRVLTIIHEDTMANIPYQPLASKCPCVL